MTGIGTTAVIGTGNIPGTLGRAFAKAGHAVVFGSRNPATSGAAGDTDAEVTTHAEAVAAAGVVLLAVPADDVEAFLTDHADALAGKLLIDATNRFPGPVLNSAELVERLVPTARYARAFNSQAWETFANPVWDGVPGTLFYTVTDPADAPAVETLIRAVGLAPLPVGLAPLPVGLARPDLLDAALFLLVPAYEAHDRRTGLRLVHD